MELACPTDRLDRCMYDIWDVLYHPILLNYHTLYVKYVLIDLCGWYYWKGFEYVFHTEKERTRNDVFKNHRYFLKHSGKYHIVKVESRKQGKVNFDYKSAELRAKLPIGKKFSLSAGAIFRTHERPYGYNPVEIWLNETNEKVKGDGVPYIPGV